MRAVLMYHSIDDTGSAVSVPPAVFREHVRWMAEGRMRVVSLDALLTSGEPEGDPAVALTFDDGFANFARAADLLLEHGLPVTVFPVTGRVGGVNDWNPPRLGIPTLPLLDWRDLERLVDRGVAIGAHTRTHPVLPSLPAAALAEEVEHSIDEIASRLGVVASSFAYPFGAISPDVEAVVAKRCRWGLTTTFAGVAAADTRTRIPRLDMYYFRRPGAIARFGTPGFGPWVRWVRARRSLRAALAAG